MRNIILICREGDSLAKFLLPQKSPKLSIKPPSSSFSVSLKRVPHESARSLNQSVSLYAKNETVLDDVCYDAFLGIQVTSNNTNAWVGSIMSSVDNGETYLPMKCEDCTGSTASTASIVVDGNADGTNLAPAQCLDGQIGYPGNNCTLVNVVSLDCSIFIHPRPFAQLSYIFIQSFEQPEEDNPEIYYFRQDNTAFFGLNRVARNSYVSGVAVVDPNQQWVSIIAL